MKKALISQIKEYLKDHKKRRSMLCILGVLSILTAVGVTGALMRPAITLGKEPICGWEEHTHTEDCYETQTTLICGQEETEGHTHTDDCYDEEGNLICGQEEAEGHTHTDECYEETSILICDLEEHTHTGDCYEAEAPEEELEEVDLEVAPTEDEALDNPEEEIVTEDESDLKEEQEEILDDLEDEIVAENEPVSGEVSTLDNPATTGSITFSFYQNGTADMSAVEFSLSINVSSSTGATYQIGSSGTPVAMSGVTDIPFHMNDTIVMSGLAFGNYTITLDGWQESTSSPYVFGGMLVSLDGGTAGFGYDNVSCSLSSVKPDTAIDYYATYQPRDECGDLKLVVNYADIYRITGNIPMRFEAIITMLPPPGKPPVNGRYGQAIFVNNVGTVMFNELPYWLSEVSASNSIKYLPADYGYAVTLPAFEGYYLARTLNGRAVESSVTGTIHRCEVDLMENAFYYKEENTTGSLMVAKTISGDAASVAKSFDFTITLNDPLYNENGFSNGSMSFKLHAGQNKSIMFLPVGMEYTIVESDNAGYTVSINGVASRNSTYHGTIVADTITNVVYDNYKSSTTNKLGIVLKKTVSGINVPNYDTEYDFRITDADGNPASGSYKMLNLGNTYPIPATGLITLKAGETTVLTGLVAGTYTITEEALSPIASTNYNSTTYRINAGSPQSGTTGSVMVTDLNMQSITFNNIYGNPPPTGGLIVSKTISGEGACPADIFNFVITLTPSSGQEVLTGVYGGLNFAANSENTASVARVSLSGGNSVAADGLPVGYTYTVAEEEANQNGYATTSTGESGTITAGSSATAVFNNDKPASAKLDLTKAVAGNGMPDPNTLYTFTLTNSVTNQPATGKYQINSGGILDIPANGQIQLKAGETAHLTKLARENHLVTENALTGEAAVNYLDSSYVVVDPGVAVGTPQQTTGDGRSVTALARTKTTTQITFTNTYAGYLLPETGGIGRVWFTIGGLVLMALSGLAYIHYYGKKRERR